MDWCIVTIGDHFDFKNGLNKGKSFFGYGTPIVNYTDVYRGGGIRAANLKGRVHLTKDEIKRFEVRKGDVFFTRTSETPDEVGLANVMLDDVKDCVFSGFVLRARQKGDFFVTLYCKYCFTTEAVRNAIVSGCTYTTRALTNGRQLSGIKIPLPKKREQTAIAEALSDADSLIASLQKLIAKKKAIKQGAMQELLTGKRRLPGFSGAWKEIVIGDERYALTDLRTLPSTTQPDYTFEYITLENVDRGRLLATMTCKYATSPSRARRIVKKNDILFGTVRPNLHSHLLIRHECINVVCSTGFCVISCVPNILCPTFLYFKFYTTEVDSQVDAIISGSNYPALSSSDVRGLKITIPEIFEEQLAIAQVLSDMDAEIEQLEKKLSKYQQVKQGMMQELLTGRIRLVDP